MNPSAPRSLLLSLLMLSPALPACADEALARKSQCLACHGVTQKVMGPAFRDVAAKYAGDPEAAKKIADSIRNGGSGRWGEIPMPPQGALPAATIQKLAAWIAAGAK
jgi:cytochrome c